MEIWSGRRGEGRGERRERERKRGRGGILRFEGLVRFQTGIVENAEGKRKQGRWKGGSWRGAFLADERRRREEGKR